MNYMLDKINLLENKDNIIKIANEVYKLIKDNKNLNDSEKLMTIELAEAILNNDLYDTSKKNA